MKKHSSKEGMIDNRMVKDNHQGGIERVMQKGKNKMDSAGHDGKMGKGDKANWRRNDAALTPRKA